MKIIYGIIGFIALGWVSSLFGIYGAFLFFAGSVYLFEYMGLGLFTSFLAAVLLQIIPILLLIQS